VIYGIRENNSDDMAKVAEAIAMPDDAPQRSWAIPSPFS